MTGLLGTDVMAVACILSGAAVGGATTMALVGGQRHHTDMACVGAAVDAHPRVVVSMDKGKGTIVVTPRVWVHTNHDCVVTNVGIQGTQEMQARMERAMARVERARARVERDRVRIQSKQLRIEGLSSADRADWGPDVSAEIQKEIQQRIQAQLKQLDEQLAKLDGGTGR